MSKELLVVFDIDETLIHFISHHYTNLFLDLPIDVQEKFKYIRDNNNIVLFRPYLQELFNYYMETPNIRVALWTYSEQEYAYHIQRLLIEILGLPEDFFLFAYGAEDMINEDGDEDDYPKNLEKVYRDFPSFNIYNTFIVDDAPGNIRHEINKNNCLLIQPFAPFSVDKVRKDLGEDGIEFALNDRMLENVQEISAKVLKDIVSCNDTIKDEDGMTDFDWLQSEHVFNKSRVKRMGLTKLMKTFVKAPCIEWKSGPVDLLTIGRPKLSKDLIELPEDMVYKGGSKKKKGGKKKKKLSKKKKTIKKKKKKKTIKKKKNKKKKIKKKL
jgi:hypothetical protein